MQPLSMRKLLRESDPKRTQDKKSSYQSLYFPVIKGPIHHSVFTEQSLASSQLHFPICVPAAMPHLPREGSVGIGGLSSCEGSRATLSTEQGSVTLRPRCWHNRDKASRALAVLLTELL